MNTVKVGVIGYTDPKFNKIEAWELLKKGFEKIKSESNTDKLMVISVRLRELMLHLRFLLKPI